MTTLTLYSTLFSIFPTGIHAQRRHRGAVHGGAAHGRAVILASSTGMSCGFDTSIVAGIASTARIIFLCTLAHIARSIRRRPQGDRYASRGTLRVVGSTYFISVPGSALAWQLLVRRISILRRRRHRRIFNAHSIVPHADRAGASTRCVRRIVPTLNFVTGILLPDGGNFSLHASEGAVILAYFSGIFAGGVRARSRRRRRGTLDLESADRRHLSDDRRAFERRSIRILARQCRCNSSPHFSLCRRREALRLNA